jgi:hypothetical protein
MQPPSERPVRFHEYRPPNQEPVSVIDWVATLLVLAIPLVNLILYLYWATSDFTAPSKKNYCRACILLFLIAVGLSLVFGLLMGGLFYTGVHRIR